QSLSSRTAITGTTTAARGEKGVLTELFVDLTDINIDQGGTTGFLADTIKDIFSSRNSLLLTGEVLISRDGIESVSVKTDFDKLINDSVGEFISDLQERITAELEDNLLEYLNPMLEDNQLLASSLDALGVQSLEQISSVNQLQTVLNNKVSELENKGNSITAELQAQAEAEVARVQAEADAAAARAKAQAEAEAAKALEQTAGKIKLPGF
ncbi:MAG: hypothetical protein JEY91_09735, partial [Spirochaetaceae bacterium]|nr:hypothetical protein [Spirochaetaceae bacterium]